MVITLYYFLLTVQGDSNGSLRSQLELSGGPTQKGMFDKNNSSLYNSFYNSASKPREREKPSFMAMFKLRDSQARHNPIASPTPKQMKNSLQAPRDAQMVPEKPVTFDLGKANRRNDLNLKIKDLSQWQTSRQKSINQLEYQFSLNRSGADLNSSSQHYSPSNSQERHKPKVRLNLVPGTIEQISKRSYRIAEDQEGHQQSTSFQRIRQSPQKAVGTGSIKVIDYMSLDDNQEGKSPYRSQHEIENHLPVVSGETGHNRTEKKVIRRGFSIDQGVGEGEERPQSSRRGQGKNSSYEYKPASPDKKSGVKKTAEQLYYQQQQDQQKQLQMQLHLQLQLKLQHQQQQQYEQQQQLLHQQQMQEAIVLNNEEDQVKFFEKYLHVDKMTFDFEKMMLMKRYKKQHSQHTQGSTLPTKQSTHTRTRSMEDPESLAPTKSSSRAHIVRHGSEEINSDGETA